MNKLFVVMSHTLTQAQKDDFVASYGATKFITLQEVSPELSKNCQQVDPSASLADIQKIAEKVVKCAADNNATHFYFAGEPTLAMWANLYAYYWIGYPEKISGEWRSVVTNTILNTTKVKPMICVQSTTERISQDVPQSDGSVKKISTFSHVQWRKLF